jgi:ATP-dependent Zn protease
MNDWMSLLVSWLPFLVLIGLWFWLARRGGLQARGLSGTTIIDLYEQQVAECRRISLSLERIAASLEKCEGSPKS